MTDPTVPWRRLDARSVLVSAAWLVPPLLSTALTLLLTGGEINLPALITLGSIFLTFLGIAAVFLLRQRTTRFRVTDQRVEVHSGVLFRRRRAVPRARIRGVDLTASPMHRLLGLRAVRISTGQDSDADSRELVLDGVSVASAEELRQRLFAGGAGRPIATIDWRWLRYAPLTMWGYAGIGVILGTFFELVDALRINPADIGVLRGIARGITALPLWASIVIPLIVVVAVGAAGGVLALIENWWGFQLEHADRALRSRRGLFTTRSFWLEKRRLRGLQVAEPVLLRWAGGARLNAIAVGLGNSDDSSISRRSVLLPPAPLAEVHRVAAVVLDESPDVISRIRLRGHPQAALRRRLGWGIGLVMLAEVPLVVLGVVLTEVLLHIAWASALVLLPVAVLAALDAHRSLGHAVDGPYLVTRYGTFLRRTVLIDCAGIIGWRVTQSFFQRRAGLLTISPVVAAGRGAYKVRDVAVADGLEIAEKATPGMMTSFLE
ncbi:PH domain-containing protein [Parafrankia elaeagni]|uniref:PH domain-containing protein n=1 Tax=Parafrankia elaeagni TaxID=222534 RepID=UPI000378F05A|nr:PH domain-containing protein [Parafrankia elaeagni]